MYKYTVYILASDQGILYIGVTNNLHRRIVEHVKGVNKSFTKKYLCNRLVYFEEFDNVDYAIGREKQLKRWNRAKKIFLINRMNPTWKNFAEEML